MEKRHKRVSLTQWDIMLEFLERNPILAKGYNNSARGRELSTRLWKQLAVLLNSEGSGSNKTPKEWAVDPAIRQWLLDEKENKKHCLYICLRVREMLTSKADFDTFLRYLQNFKSKLKKSIAILTAENDGTGGGPAEAEPLTNVEERLLAILGPGFGQGAPNVRVNPFPNAAVPQRDHHVEEPQRDHNVEEVAIMPELIEMEVEFHEEPEEENLRPAAVQEAGEPLVHDLAPALDAPPPLAADASPPSGANAPPLPRATRRTRYRTRPMAPLDEARRILSTIEMQRAASDAATARALEQIGQNLGRLASVAERYAAAYNL